MKKVTKKSKSKTNKNLIKKTIADEDASNIFIDIKPNLDCHSSNIIKSKSNHKRKKSTSKNDSLQRYLTEQERHLTDVLFGENDALLKTESLIFDLQEAEAASNREEQNRDYDSVNNEWMTVDTEGRVGDEDDYEFLNDSLQDETRHNKKERKIAWVDEDDEGTRIKDVAASYSKAKGSRSVRETSEILYKEALKEKFDEIYGPSPEWAQFDRKVDPEEDDNDMSAKTTLYLASKSKLSSLPKKSLDFKLVANLNGASQKEGGLIKAIDFCPELGIALVAGCNRVLGAATLFQFDGKKNHRIKSIAFPNFPIKCARFLPSKQQFVVGSNERSRFYVYDIKKGEKSDVFRSLKNNDGTMKNFEVTPDGRYVVSIKTGGWICFVDSTSMAHVVNVRVPFEVNAITFNSSSTLMYIHGDTGNVYIYDLENWKCLHRFYDDGCISGTSIALSPNDGLLACGSSSGIVNVYDATTVCDLGPSPQPIKSINKLVTPVTSLAFHPSSDILAMASVHKENALKLVHTKSMTVFANFPGPYNFQRIQTLKFSPDSKFLSFGNNRKTAYLCRLLHY